AGSTPARDHGSSDFDLRHALSASLHWKPPSSWRLPALARGWSLDGIAHARTGFPITVLDAEQYAGISLMNAFRPNVVPNVPVWLDGRLNPAAFRPAGDRQGNLGRNTIAGFGMWQFDLALRREFRVADKRTLEFRITAFNALNHPNLADPVRYLN